MVKWDLLEKHAIKCYDQILISPTGSELTQQFLADHKTQKVIEAYEQIWRAYRTLRAVNMILRLNKEFPQLDPDQYYSLHIGSTMVEHTFNNQVQHVVAQQGLLEVLVKNGSHNRISELVPQQDYCDTYDVGRIGCLNSGFMVTGDPKYNQELTATMVKSLFRIHNGLPIPNIRQNTTGGLYQIAIELASNSNNNVMKAARTDPETDTNVEVEFGPNYLKVSDNGTGVQDKILPLICGSFTDSPRGTGLGLRIVKHLCYLSGAKLNVWTRTEGDKTTIYNPDTAKLIKTEMPRRRGTDMIVRF